MGTLGRKRVQAEGEDSFSVPVLPEQELGMSDRDSSTRYLKRPIDPSYSHLTSRVGQIQNECGILHQGISVPSEGCASPAV